MVWTKMVTTSLFIGATMIDYSTEVHTFLFDYLNQVIFVPLVPLWLLPVLIYLRENWILYLL